MKFKNIVAIIVLAMSTPSIYAQVGFGTSTPNQDAVIDLTSNSKGLLIPRLALTSTSVATPLSAHVGGMMVYNTATTGNVKPGFYINNGTEWKPMSISSGSGAPTGQGATGEVYVDATTGNIFTYNGTSWQSSSTQSGAGDPNGNGTIGSSGDIYADTANNMLWIHDGTSWVLLDTTESLTSFALGTGANEGNYIYTDENGDQTLVPITRTGAGAPSGIAPAGGIYVDTNTGDIYTYNGTSWSASSPQSGTTNPNLGPVAGTAGNIYVNETTGDLYTHNGTSWVLSAPATSDATNDAFVNNSTNNRVELGTKSDGSARNANTQFVMHDNGDISLGADTVPPSWEGWVNMYINARSNQDGRIMIKSDYLGLNDVGFETYSNFGGTLTQEMKIGHYNARVQFWSPRLPMVIGTSNGTTPQSLVFATGAGNTRMTISGTGEIGMAGAPVVGTRLLVNLAGATTTDNRIGQSITNTSTTTTDGLTKTGLNISSTGAWTGATNINRGLVVNVAGGTTNYAALFTGGNVGIKTTTPRASLDVVATDAIITPSGTTAQRPATPVFGMVRYNSTIGRGEMYVNDVNGDGTQGDTGWRAF